MAVPMVRVETTAGASMLLNLEPHGQRPVTCRNHCTSVIRWWGRRPQHVAVLSRSFCLGARHACRTCQHAGPSANGLPFTCARGS